MRNSVGRNCRPEEMLTSKNMINFFSKQTYDGNQEGVPY